MTEIRECNNTIKFLIERAGWNLIDAKLCFKGEFYGRALGKLGCVFADLKKAQQTIEYSIKPENSTFE